MSTKQIEQLILPFPTLITHKQALAPIQSIRPLLLVDKRRPFFLRLDLTGVGVLEH
jgi:hypothetical protein